MGRIEIEIMKNSKGSEEEKTGGKVLGEAREN